MNLIPVIKSLFVPGAQAAPRSTDIAAMIEAEEARARELASQLGGLTAEERAAALRDGETFNAVAERREALERAQRQCALRLEALQVELVKAQKTEATAEVDEALADARAAQAEGVKLIGEYEAQAAAMAKTLRAMKSTTERIQRANKKASDAGRLNERVAFAPPLAGWTWGSYGNLQCMSDMVKLPSAFGTYFSHEYPNGIEYR